MHRSGTSFLASWLQASGLYIGERLAGATPSNVKGHFEDIDFLELHERMLKDNSATMYMFEQQALEVSEDRLMEADAFISERNEKHELWGFKQPRATLFLDTWKSWLPRAKYIIALRHPASVINSILRRESNKCILRNDAIEGPRLQAAYLENLDMHAAKYDAMTALHLQCVVEQLENNREDEFFIFNFDERATEASRLQRQFAAWNMPISLIPIEDLYEQKLLIGSQEFLFPEERISEACMHYYNRLLEFTTS